MSAVEVPWFRDMFDGDGWIADLIAPELTPCRFDHRDGFFVVAEQRRGRPVCGEPWRGPEWSECVLPPGHEFPHLGHTNPKLRGRVIFTEWGRAASRGASDTNTREDR